MKHFQLSKSFVVFLDLSGSGGKHLEWENLVLHGVEGYGFTVQDETGDSLLGSFQNILHNVGVLPSVVFEVSGIYTHCSILQFVNLQIFNLLSAEKRKDSTNLSSFPIVFELASEFHVLESARHFSEKKKEEKKKAF
jgi:hypothetical protein